MAGAAGLGIGDRRRRGCLGHDDGQRYTNAAAPHADAFIAAASLGAQYLLAHKRLENWLIWIAVDVVAIAVYWGRDLRLTAGLYLVFLVLAAIGLRAWLRAVAPPDRATAGQAA